MIHKLKDLKARNSDKGFTIIEVMIVLAIAGLILLIVFLAVPALQRNARNTSRKNDAANILAGLNEYVSNNSGSYPADNPTFQAKILANGNVKLGNYTAANITYTYNASVPATAPTPAASTDNVYVYTGVACSNNAPTVSGASARTAAIVYWVETSNGNTPQCTQS